MQIGRFILERRASEGQYWFARNRACRQLAVFALALFIPAGTIKWIARWCLLILFFGLAAIMNMWLLKHNPSLLQERIAGLGKPDQEAGDKVIISLIVAIFYVAWLVLMPLDAVRFKWSHTPVLLHTVGAMILIASFYLF